MSSKVLNRLIAEEIAGQVAKLPPPVPVAMPAMTLREWYAGMAMEGLLHAVIQIPLSSNDERIIARDAVNMADKLIDKLREAKE